MAVPDLVEIARFPQLTKAQYDRVEGYLQQWKKEVTAAIKRYPKGSYKLGQEQMMAWLRLLGKLGPSTQFGGVSPTSQLAVGWLERQTDMEISAALDRYIDQIRQSLLYGLRAGVNPTEVAAWLYRATKDAEVNWRVIARTEMSRANNQGRLDICAQQGFEMVWAPPHLFACERCKRIVENRPFRIEEVRHVPPKGSDAPYLPLHPRCRHVWVGYDPDVFEIQQENQRKVEATGYTEEQLDRMFDSGGQLLPEFKDAVDWSLFKGLDPYEWTMADALTKVSEVRKGFFSNPQLDLDPLFFRDGRLRADVRETIMRWFRFAFPTGLQWAKLYVTGGATSQSYEGSYEHDPDLDLQIVVDYEKLRAAEPAYATLSSPELHTALLTMIRASSAEVEAAPGVPLRPFIRPELSFGAFRHDAILTGQNVWDVLSGRFLYRAPAPSSVEHYGLPLLEGIGAEVAQIHPEWLARARLKAQQIDELIERYDGGEPMVLAMRETFDELHAERKRSFTPGGGGERGEGNFIWQYLVNYGSLFRLQQLLDQPAMAKIAPGYAISQDTVAKRALAAPPAGYKAGVEHWITVHPNGPGEDGHPVLVRNLSSGQMMVMGGMGGHLNGVRLDPKRRIKGDKGVKTGPEEQPLSAEEEAASRKEFEHAQKLAERHLGKLREQEGDLKQRIADFMDANVKINDGSVPFSELSPSDQISARSRAFNSALAAVTVSHLDKSELQDAIRLKHDREEIEEQKPEVAGEEYGKPGEAESQPQPEVEPEGDTEWDEPPKEPRHHKPLIYLDDEQAQSVMDLRAEMSLLRAQIRKANSTLRGEDLKTDAFTMDWRAGIDDRKARMIEDETRTQIWRGMAQALDDRGGNSRLTKAINQGGMDALNDIGQAIGVGEAIPPRTQKLLGTAGTVQIMAHLIQAQAAEGKVDVDKLIGQLDQIRDEREKRVVSLGVIRAQKAASDAQIAVLDLRDVKEGNSVSTSTNARSRLQSKLIEACSSLGSAVSGYEAMGSLREALMRKRDRMQLTGFDHASQIQALAHQAGVKLPRGAIKKIPGGQFMLDMEMDGFVNLLHPTHEVHSELSHRLAAIRTPVELAGAVQAARTNIPGYTGPTLKPSQAQGRLWLREAGSGVLAFEPGTGKTLTALAGALDVLAEHPDHHVLVVAPTNALCDVWASQINANTEAGKFTVKVIGKRGLTEDSGDLSGPKAKITQITEPTTFTIVSYETLASNAESKIGDEFVSYREMFRRQGYQVVIADEAQKVRNQKIGLAQGLDVVTGKAEHKWALTGTPVHKSLKDLHAIYTWARGGTRELGMDNKEFDDKWRRCGQFQHATAEEQVQRFRDSLEDGLFWQPAQSNRKKGDPTLNPATKGEPEVHEVPLDPDHLDAVKAGVAEFERQRVENKERGLEAPSTALINRPTYRPDGSNAIHREIAKMADEHPSSRFQGKDYAPKTIVFDYEVQTLKPLVAEAKKRGIKVFFTSGEEKKNDEILEKFRKHDGKAILVTSDKNKAAVSLQFGYNIGPDGVSRFQHGATQVIHLRPPRSNGDREQRVARAFRNGAVADVDEHIMIPTDEHGHRFPYPQAAIERLQNERRLADMVGGPEGRPSESEPLRDRLAKASWHESEHPRVPEGNEEGGRFTPKEGGGASTPGDTRQGRNAPDRPAIRGAAPLRSIGSIRAEVDRQARADLGGSSTAAAIVERGRPRTQPPSQGRLFSNEHIETKERDLRKRKVKVIRSMNGGHINEAWNVHLEGDGDAMVKPLRGSVPWAAAHPTVPYGFGPERERAAYLIARRMGVDTPVVTVRSLKQDHPGGGPYGKCSVQEWRDFDPLTEYDYIQPEQQRRVGLFDVVIGNLDRHGGQLGLDADGNLIAFDHEFSFPEYFIGEREWGNSVMVGAFIHQPLTAEEIGTLERLRSPEVGVELHEAGVPERAIEHMRWRCHAMIEEGEVLHPAEADTWHRDLLEIEHEMDEAEIRWNREYRNWAQENPELLERMIANAREHGARTPRDPFKTPLSRSDRDHIREIEAMYAGGQPLSQIASIRELPIARVLDLLERDGFDVDDERVSRGIE